MTIVPLIYNLTREQSSRYWPTIMILDRKRPIRILWLEEESSIIPSEFSYCITDGEDRQGDFGYKED